MKEKLHLPEGHQQPSIAEGVMHGPYPVSYTYENQDSPAYSALKGHREAIEDAFLSERIDYAQFKKLDSNLRALEDEDTRFELGIGEEADINEALKVYRDSRKATHD